MAADHWMRFNIGDYLADTMHLTTLQHGIYILLIMHYFKRGEMPSDERSLARIAKVSMPIWRRISGPVMALFKIENGVTHHRRIDFERAAAHKRNGEEKQELNGTTHAAGQRARLDLSPQPIIKEAPLIPPITGGNDGRGGLMVVGEEGKGNECRQLAESQPDVDTNRRPHQRGAAVVPLTRRAIGR